MNLKRYLFVVLMFAAASLTECPAQAKIDTVRLWEPAGKDHSDTILYSFVPEKPNGAAVIICPGGSYCWLDMKGEGIPTAEWLNQQGITAFVLHYRTIGFSSYFWHNRIIARGNRHPDMITDVQRAIQWVNGFAEKYGVDRDRIGVMGFSAGGHLAMSAACFSHDDFLDKAGVQSNVDLRPAFVASIYPVVTMTKPYVHKRSRRALLGEDKRNNKMMIDSLSLEFHIPADCPPVFLANCKDDKVVDYHNSVVLDRALSEAGVSHVYFQYETGGHGFGVSEIRGSEESRQWKWDFLKWLKEIGII